MIDASHRRITGKCSLEDYRMAADILVHELQSLECMKSIVLCGSLVKETVVPGWSDIDLVIFVDHLCPELYPGIRRAVRRATERARIGVGIDLVVEKEFKATQRLCGKPLAMRYEVADYGLVKFGDNPFARCRISREVQSRINYESILEISSLVHNWRRRLLAKKNLFSLHYLAECVKNSLKILKFESNILIERPYTYENAYKIVANEYSLHPSLRMFEAAIQVRRSWREMTVNPDIKKLASFLSDSISGYPLSWWFGR